MVSRSTTPGTLTVASRAASYTQLNDLPFGMISYVTVTANTGSFTSVATLSGFDTGTFATLANRYYRIYFELAFQTTVNPDVVRVFLTDGSNTALANSDVFLDSPNLNTQVGRSYIDAPGASATTRYKVRAQRLTSSGTCIGACDTDFPGYLTVEDIGPSTGWA